MEDFDGEKLLHAAGDGRVDIVKSLIAGGVDVNYQDAKVECMFYQCQMMFFVII
jgi:hypothetical protein